MGRIGRVLAALGLALGAGLASGAGAQDFSGLARLDAGRSRVADEGRGLAVELALSQPVPWRVLTLDAPRRLVVEFRTVDWDGADLGALLHAEGATGLRAGPAGEGWSRLVIDLARPFGVTRAGMAVEAGGGARLLLRLDPVDGDAFAAAVGALPDALPGAAPAPPMAPPGDGRLVVAIDPGHGGIDPGAEREGLRESRAMLALALELAEAAARAGMTPALTRAEDRFVPLGARMTVAREAGADVLLSLHADALEEGAASGASVYTLSEEAAGEASERMVERHERGDLLAGLDLAGADDAVATALLDLARQDTGPASGRLAEAVVAGLRQAGAPVNSRPHREARLAVLSAADFPSVLVEVGFLSNDGDRARLGSPEGRAPIVAGLLAALESWEAEEGAREGLRLR